MCPPANSSDEAKNLAARILNEAMEGTRSSYGGPVTVSYKEARILGLPCNGRRKCVVTTLKELNRIYLNGAN